MNRVFLEYVYAPRVYVSVCVVVYMLTHLVSNRNFHIHASRHARAPTRTHTHAHIHSRAHTYAPTHTCRRTHTHVYNIYTIRNSSSTPNKRVSADSLRQMFRRVMKPVISKGVPCFAATWFSVCLYRAVPMLILQMVFVMLNKDNNI